MVIIRLESIFPFITAHLQVTHGTPVFPGTQYEKHYPSGLVVVVYSTMLTERDPIIFKFKKAISEKKRDGSRKLVSSVLQSLLPLSLALLGKAGLWKSTDRP